MSTLAALLLAAFAAALVYRVVVLTRRMLRDDGRLRLLDALRGQGLALQQDAGDAALREGAFAARRCVGCNAHERCDALLAARDWRALREICPNSTYFDRLPAG